MAGLQTVEHVADAKAGMTLRELAAFVQDAMRRDLDGTVVVKARVTFGGGLRCVSVTGPVQ